ncbi:type II toxin-antitoxin system VapC family toxin [Chroogloeocystis siderophila]|nr:PIN domain-containing protein [Chroogloeocystis siderophila]
MEGAIVVADTGFVVALLNRSDIRHTEVIAVYLQYQQILLPQTVLAEVTYLLGRDAGILTVVAFLRGIAASRFKLAALTNSDLERIATILEKYADSRIDFVVASVMAVAERFNIRTILILDQQDFRIFRPQHCAMFNILP